MIRFVRRALALVLAAAAQGAAGEPPRVVASIAPLHSLVAAVMLDVGEPGLLVRGYGSPHTFQLRPSSARLLSEAQIVFQVGGQMETFLQKPLAALAGGARVVSLWRAPGLRLLAQRRAGVWRADEDGHPEAQVGDGLPDPHLWLDPGNAQHLARAIAAELGAADPGNAARYRTNATRLVARIEAADRSWQVRLAPVAATPFVVFHDAYQYLERAYRLNAVGALAVSPERPPGARRLSELRQRIRALGVRCVFREPQFESALLASLLEGSTARGGVLDPLGARHDPGPDAWFRMMQSNVEALEACLAS